MLNPDYPEVRVSRDDLIASISTRIAAFEAEHGMTSAEMCARIERGELAPTLMLEAWCMALRVRDELLGGSKP